MGLLDDAIREHLELKRRHGANPVEVAQQEQEALGPPHRGEFTPPAGEPAALPSEVPGAVAATEDALDDDAPGIPEIPRAHHPAEAPGYDEDPWVEAEDPPAVERAADDEDVLEETPEFLQETPEHDRLWFEQKPPRDFDWDK